MKIRLPRRKRGPSFEATLACAFLAAALLTVIGGLVWQARGNLKEANEERAHTLANVGCQRK